MMRALMFSLFLLAAVPAQAQQLGVSKAYAFATSAQQKNGAVFLVIDNPGAEDWLGSASTDVAERTELHTHVKDGGVMMMRKLDFYEIPAAGKLTLEPMGHHIMLMNLHEPLKAGENFPLTLNFEMAGSVTVDVAVVPPGQKPE